MKNKRIRRGIALIVSVLVGLQLFPMSALAAMMVTEEIATNVSASGNNAVPDIVAEVVEERDEFSKVYLLEDGSFYSITTTAPVHKMEGGKWENIDESLEKSENKTVESAEKALLEASSQYMQLLSVNSNSRTLSSQQETSSMIVNSLSCTELPGGGFVLGEGSMIVAKPASINNYLKNNKVIIEANLAFSCVVGDDHIEGSTIDIYEANFGWDEESTEEEILNVFNDEMLPIDHISMDTDGTYYWDITDTYSRWDKEVTTNNGFFIHAGEESSLTISDMFISVRYEEVGEDDKDYSYHTFDMGRAGKVYINDFTNTMRLEQDILGIDGSVLPVEIKRYYNETEPSYMNTAGVGFRWNYESSILHDNNIVTWKMFDGTIKRFVQSSPLETNGDYQKWIDVNCDVMLNETAILWIKSTEISAMNKNYENYYVELNENAYEFNSIGNLVKVMQGTENYIRINYDNNNSITSVVDSANHTFEFTYANNTTGYKHVVNVSAKNTTTGAPIQIMAATGDATTVSVGFATSYDASTKITTNTITYSDGKTVIYKFNFDGELIEIIGTDGSRLVYEVEENTGDSSHFIKYTKYVTNGENEFVEEILKIDSRNTYQRKFIDKDGKEELIQYDRDINVVTHRSTKGDYVFAEYDDNGLLKSYVVPEAKTELLVNSSFDNANALNINSWTKSNKNFVKSQASTLDDDKMVVFDYETNYSATLRQNCKIDGYTFKADQTYVAGAWAKLKNVYPSGERGLKINIYPMYDEDTGFVSEPVATVSYDTCAPDEWQYMLVAFKLERDALQLRFSIEHIDQIGEVCVDQATLYEAANVAVDLPNIIETSPYTITKNTDGAISSEVFSDGEISFVKSYEYENNQIASITDFNGITTYYNYDANTGLLKSQGTIKGEDGIIINPTEFIYDSNKRLTEIKQVVTNISSANDVTMTTQYGYNDNNQIESITHNGVTYVFEYNNDEILSVDTESSSYTKGENEAKLIEYYYNESGNIGEINYKNGLNIVYTYTDDKIAEIDYRVNNASVKKYVYTYNGDDVSSATDTQSNIKVIYTIDGYELYRITGDNLVLMYKQTKNIDGSVVETYMPDYYSVDGVPKSIVTTSADTVVIDEETAHETKTSTVSMSKITDWNSEEDYDEKNLAYTRRSISDYFGRVYQSSIEMQTVNSNNEKGKITEAYTYDELSSGVESTRVITYSTNLEMVSDDSETNRIVFSSEIFYEYDSNGNITFVYSKDSADNINPIAYYQYDEANQIVGELNYDKEVSVTYTYDAGGNLTSKINHNMSEAIVDTAVKKVTSYGAVTDVISYGYDDVWKDRLTNYNGTTISYDASGNPLNFAGKTFKVISESTIPEEIMQNNENVSANLEWTGKYLAAFETDEYRYEYTYDENGYRTKKTCFDKVLNDSNEYIYELETEIIYVWDNGVLRSIINNSNTTEPMRSDIIYDQDGNMSGFFSNLGGTFFFIKDNNGSVRKLIDETGVAVASFDYDAWGQMKVTIHVDTSTTSGQMGYLVYAMIIVLNPVAYNGYLFDYESGLYFSKDKVYSPTWGRYLNPVDADILKEKTQNANDSNLYVFCNNNPVNIIESNSAWNRRDKGLKFVTNGFKVNMNEIFLSRPFCVVFANQIIKEYGSFDVNNGYLYKGMDTLDIASSLFAHSVGKYAQSSINKVNATWGDGWILNNSKSNTIVVVNDETLMWKYLKIWYAASEIKTYAWSSGIYITL